MKIHSANFDFESGCAGTNLGQFHKGYFADPIKAKLFSDAFVAMIEQKPNPKKSITILGLGSGPALPEIIIYRSLTKAGYKVKMIISDKIKEAIDTHYPGYEPESHEKIDKYIFDSREIPFPDQNFDAVVTRDSIHYQENIIEMKIILQEIKRVLKPQGIFLNQETNFPNPEEANLANFERQLVGKHVKHLSGQKIISLHKEVFGRENVVQIKTPNLDAIYSDEIELIKRFNIDQIRQKKITDTMLYQIKNLLEQKTSTENVKFLNDPQNRYMRLTPVQIISAQKK